MKFAIMSVPHTGTHFVLNLLGGSRDELADWMNKEFRANNGHVFYVSHVYRLPIFEMVESKGYNIIAPLRHPITTVKSWHDKYTKEPVEIPEGMTDQEVAEIERYVKPSWVPKLYKAMIVASQLYDINFIPIDSPHRDDYLRKFKKKFGLQLNTFWKPLNSHGESTIELPDDLLTSTQNMMNENKEFFDMFY
jgi:hypothetical protein